MAEEPYLIADIEPGNPNNWPRTIAREQSDLEDAVRTLCDQIDELNMYFAITEFTSERVTLAARQKEG